MSDITVSTVVGSLIPSTQYVFTVTAFNGAGRGMDSNTTEAETAAGRKPLTYMCNKYYITILIGSHSPGDSL